MFEPFTAGAPASDKALARLCDRVALSLGSGIDIRRVWRSELKRSRGRLALACGDVARAVDSGEALDQAIAEAGPVFPTLLAELVRVGERTGSTAEVFARLARFYERRVARAREFRSAIAWPVLQLVAAISIVAVLIALGGVLVDFRGRPLDLLGIGLTGTSGVLAYAGYVAGTATALALGWTALKRRPDWGAWLVGRLSGLPVVGPPLRKIALSRIAWALKLTMNVDMDLRRVAPVVLRASGNARYARHAGAVVDAVGAGQPFSEAFGATDEFPPRFLDALRVAEESGTLVETMGRLSSQYDDEAEHAVAVLTRVAAFLIWAAIAALIVVLIFRVFSFYTGVLNQAIEGF